MNNSHHSKEDYPFNDAFELIREMQTKIDSLEESNMGLHLKSLDLGQLMIDTAKVLGTIGTKIGSLEKLSLQQQERIEEQDRMINILERERK